MKKIFSLLFSFVFILPTLSFAFSRQEAIERTLDYVEAEGSPGIQIHRNEDRKTERECAIETDMRKARFYISGGYNASHIHYKEFRSGSSDTLDEDYGDLEGFFFTLGYRSSKHYPDLLGRPFVELYFRRSANLITYDGASGAGPLEFDDEHAKIFRYGLKLGSSRDFSEKSELFGYVDVGRRVWYRGQNRLVSGVLDYAEKYWWTYFGAGGGLSYQIIPRLSAAFDVELMFSNSSLAKMRADLYEGGTFALRNVYGAEVKFPLKYQLSKNFSLDLTPYFTYWHIKASGLVPIAGSYYYEPDSRTHTEGLLAGITYYF